MKVLPMSFRVIHGNNLTVLRQLIDEGVRVDSVVTDPPYGLSDSKDTPYNILKILSEITFPEFDQLVTEFCDDVSLTGIPINIVNLDRMNGAVRVEAGVAVPECSINFDDHVLFGQEKITDRTKPAIRSSNDELPDEPDVQCSEFLGDYIFDLRNAWNFTSTDGFASRFAQLDAGGFSVFVSPVFSPSNPSPLACRTAVILAEQDIRMCDRSPGQSSRHTSPFTSDGTVNGFVLRFDLRRGAIEFDTTNSAIHSDRITDELCPKLIGTLAATSCLSAKFEPCRVSLVCGSTDRTYHFNIWLHKNWLKTLKAIYAKSGFMGKQWDATVPSVEFWKLVFQILKPGGHVLSFGGTRTYHRMVVNLEDAGFEIRDQLVWLYGSGFPKSMDISKAMDKAAGVEREVIGISSGPNASKYTGERYTQKRQTSFGVVQDQPEKTAPATPEALRWNGWGTALKPAIEPIVLARKPFQGTVADNVLEHGTGGINIDGCRIAGGDEYEATARVNDHRFAGNNSYMSAGDESLKPGFSPNASGRWPANVLFDETAADLLDEQTGDLKAGAYVGHNRNSEEIGNRIYGARRKDTNDAGYGGTGGASRFFYCAKASKKERRGSTHPTVKPVALMRYLCRLITPPGGTVLDPFAGTGVTGEAALDEKFMPILIEIDENYVKDIHRRLAERPVDLESLY